MQFYKYQFEADNAIYKELELENANKCLVKMFCGTGKSLLMRKCKIVENKKLVVYVFPTLSLINQFNTDYLHDFPKKYILKISSDLEHESTTNSDKINTFISKKANKIICVTYQSFTTLLENLGDNKINVCLFDEAHHAVGEKYQTVIFNNDACEKQIFFTATPKNANGIIMFNSDNPELSMCGKLVYDYSYLSGMFDGYLNPFEIRVDMYTENTNKSVFESIARAILVSGNNRVLTFHSYVNTDSETSVNNFVNNAEFVAVFKKIRETEFPENNTYTKISMIGLTSANSTTYRDKILKQFDKTLENEVIVISSCATIGEGIDTKNANMCVFVDPKTSNVQIIQNIGRIVRKQFGIDKPKSTILIPCWVNKDKYIECDGDKEKCNNVIRNEMSTDGGDFNGILQVLSALKQEDEELYEICLHYPNEPSPNEVRANFEKQGYTVDDDFDGELFDVVEHMLDTELELEDYDNEEEMLERIAEDNEVCIEIHSGSEIKKYNSDCEESIRIYKMVDDDSESGVIYKPIVKKEGELKKTKDTVFGIKKENKMGFHIETSGDVKVLWNIIGDLDITKDISSCIIDCEVVIEDPMEKVEKLIERAYTRKEQGLNLLPRNIYKKEDRTTPELEQEYKDIIKLSHFRSALKGKGHSKCSNEVRDLLDEKMPGWRDDLDEKALEDAENIIERAYARKEKGLNLLPRQISK